MVGWEVRECRGHPVPVLLIRLGLPERFNWHSLCRCGVAPQRVASSPPLGLGGCTASGTSLGLCRGTNWVLALAPVKLVNGTPVIEEQLARRIGCWASAA